MELLFGKSESKQEIPGWLKDAATEMLDRSLSMGKTGYMPWSGPDVAALTPDQLAARENTNSAASAFGMSVGGLGTPGAQDFGNGIWGHSSLPLYNQQMDYMQENRPGQLDYYNSHFVDPVTGAPGANMNQRQQQQQPMNLDPREQQMLNDILHGHEGGMAGATHQAQRSSAGPQQGGNFFGGYSGLGDMFDGGGPGASGPTYQGGGILSDFGNARNTRRGTKPGGGLLGGRF